MFSRTEDLLKIRDGEPIDVGLRARLLADPGARAELERLRRLAGELQRLPELEPRGDHWPQIRQLADSAADQPDPVARRWLLGLAAGFALVVTALLWDAAGPPAPTEQARAPAVAAVRPVAEPLLRAQSARLERVLSTLPARRQVMSAATAGTIAGLEDHVAAIDARLNLGVSGDLELGYREALWRERVDLMTALVEVRYAQAQSFGR